MSNGQRAIHESPDAYTTPALLRYGSTTEIVVTGGDVATGHDTATGKELWRANGLNPTNDPTTGSWPRRLCPAT